MLFPGLWQSCSIGEDFAEKISGPEAATFCNRSDELAVMTLASDQLPPSLIPPLNPK